MLRRAELFKKVNAQTLSTHHRGLPQPTPIVETPAHKAHSLHSWMSLAHIYRGGNSVMLEPFIINVSFQNTLQIYKL